MRKICELQCRLVVPKGRYNSFGKFHYRSCDDIVRAVKPLAKELGMTLLLSDSLEVVDERYYIAAEATLYDHESGQSVTVKGYAREAQAKKGSDEAQVTGMASTYARKYALNGLLALDDSDDPDAHATGAFVAACTACGVQYEFADEGQMQAFTCQCGNSDFKAV